MRHSINANLFILVKIIKKRKSLKVKTFLSQQKGFVYVLSQQDTDKKNCKLSSFHFLNV